MRDTNNRTIMQYICEKLKLEDGEEFLNIKNEFKNVYILVQYNLKDEDTKIKDMKSYYDKAKGNFETVEKSLDGQAPDNYCIKIKEFLFAASKNIEEYEKKLESIKKQYLSTCEYFLIDKSDEKTTNSQEFFKFFAQFVDNVVKNMPKEEKKRAVNANASRKFGQKIEGMNSKVDNELKSKLNAFLSK